MTIDWMLKSLLAGLGIAFGLGMMYLVRRDRLHGSYGVWWIAIALCIVTFGLWPELIDWIGARLGVGYPPILLVVVALLLMFAKQLLGDLDRTRQLRKIRYLAQRMAILEHEIRKRD